MTDAGAGAGVRGDAKRRGGAPSTIGQLLPDVLRDAGFTVRRRAGTGPGDVWTRAAGPELAEVTRAGSLQRGVLTVEVRSASLLAELKGFRTDELLARVLAEEPSGRITGLRFRLGVF